MKEPLSIIRGDQKVKEIAGASIIAKVFRDELMRTYALLTPNFSVEKHK
jgi:ribonuclease HII